ncbi:MAG: MarR family transcriptional regulator [Calditrichaeota bacterium]|nr:MAG: MarR family transcriptional regulator [Calditrichota bacterium]
MKPKDFTSAGMEKAPAYLIYRTARVLRMFFIKMMKNSGNDLTQEQWLILNRIRNQEGISQTELSDSVFNDRPNITRIVDSLIKRNFVTRRKDANDGRKFNVFLTKEGEIFVEKITKVVEKERERIYKGISENELEQLSNFLQKFEKNILE